MSYGHSLPDVTNGAPCCMGSAVYGHTRCTCWTTEHNVAQALPVEGPEQVRPRMCRDCAFRPDSPERAGHVDYDHNSAEEIEELTEGANIFHCHQGMRRCVAHVHDNGARVAASPSEYAPLITGGRVYKADGTPADLCAGWAREVERKRLEAEDDDGTVSDAA